MRSETNITHQWHSILLTMTFFELDLKGEPMEKSRAIELLKLAVPIKALTQQEYADFVEAVNMGMNALEQPTSPDAIDRKAALKALRKCQTYLYDARDPELKIELSSAEAAINNLSTIQPEKAQLFKEGTTSNLISRMETVEHLRRVLDATVPITDYDSGYVDGVEFGISTVSTMPPAQPEPAIPVSWVEGQIERLNNTDNYFAKLTANIIKTMLNEWKKGEQK
jgi:hypothetical protein